MPAVYSTINDYDYLQNDNDWKERLLVRLQMLFRAIKAPSQSTSEEPQDYDGCIEKILQGVDEMIADTKNPNRKKSVRSNLVGRGAMYSYLIDKELGIDLNSEHKKEIEAIFFASYIRQLILESYEQDASAINRYKDERSSFYQRLREVYQQVQIENGDATELIYLTRFERAVMYLFEITHKIEIKLSLKVGNLLEGCPDNKRYIIGGRSAKDTMRRLSLIEHLVIKYLPDDTIAKKRKEKRTKDEVDGSQIVTQTTADFEVMEDSGLIQDQNAQYTKKQRIRDQDSSLEYTKIATAGAKSSGGGNGLIDPSLLSLVGGGLEIESNPNVIFTDFEILHENKQMEYELGYSQRLDYELKKEKSQTGSSEIYSPFLDVDAGVPYKNKKDYFYNARNHQIAAAAIPTTENVSFTYEIAIHTKVSLKRMLKVFPVDPLQKNEELLLRTERTVLKLLNSESKFPNIIRYWDWSLETQNQNEKMNYFILESMDISLPEYLQRFPPSINDRKLIVIMKDILAAVASLHNVHIIHKDLTPQKFMLKFSGQRFITKLCDLSSVVVLQNSSFYTQYIQNMKINPLQFHDPITLPKYQINPNYAAPELRVKGSASDQHSFEMDRWALGILFNLICTGSEIVQDYFVSEKWEEVVSQSVEALLPQLKQIIRGLLQVTPEKRMTLNEVQAILYTV